MRSGEEETQGCFHQDHDLFAGHSTTVLLRLDALLFYYFVDTHNLTLFCLYDVCSNIVLWYINRIELFTRDLLSRGRRTAR